MLQPSTLANGKHLGLDEVLDDLVGDGMLENEKAAMLKRVVLPQERREKHPLSVVAERGWPNLHDPKTTLSLEFLSQWLAERSDLPYLRIDPLRLDVRAITGVMSYAYAARFNILAVKVEDESVTIACTTPYQGEWVEELSQLLGKQIKRVIANPEDIKRYLLEFYTLSRSVIGATQEDSRGAPGAGIQNLEQLMELGRRGQLDANDQHVVSIVDWLLQYAFDQRASDIHLEPRREHANVRFRIDGVLHQVYQIPSAVMAAVTSRIKILGRMDVAEKRRPQDGRIKTRSPDGREVELRLSTMPTAFGEKLVMRIFDPEVLVKDPHALGFSNADVETWRSLIHEPNGILLVTGPTGSGKTTTLYSTLKELARPEVNVCTVEDPIELLDASFNQMQVQHNIGLDFASGMRTLLRQDPDIIMVGEIRDLETAEMSIQAALTGHLVFSTLHTNDAPSAITRMLDLGVPPYLLNATLLGVLAQRLVRTLCPHCKRPGEVDVAAWQELVNPWKVAPPKTAYEPVGCLECRQTGYMGRVAVYELLPVSKTIRAHIKPDTDLDELGRICLKDGMKPLRINGAQKVAAGLTTISEVMKVAALEHQH
jgi:general secretion pathway protein E